MHSSTQDEVTRADLIELVTEGLSTIWKWCQRPHQASRVRYRVGRDGQQIPERKMGRAQ